MPPANFQGDWSQRTFFDRKKHPRRYLPLRMFDGFVVKIFILKPTSIQFCRALSTHVYRT